MTNQQLETFLFQYTESEQRHLCEQPPQLSPRYRNIPIPTLCEAYHKHLYL